MNDLTLLYYTANIAPEKFAENVRRHLLETTENKIPIISISQKPLDFGHNICVGEIGVSIYNEYRQIFEGVKEARTDYIACCEDDTLYNMEHFAHRPEHHVVSYNMNKWLLDERLIFFAGTRYSMLGCICGTDFMREILEKRFNKYPDIAMCENVSHRRRIGFGEPGKGERGLGLPVVPVERFVTQNPLVTFHLKGSLCSMPSRPRCSEKREDLEPWGNGKELWKKFYGEGE
jgi:hypothetical protein